MSNGPVKYVPKFDRKFIRETRFHDERGTARTLGAFAQRGCRVAGEQDDRNVSRSYFPLQILNELPSVTARYGQVGNDDVRVRLPSSLPGLRTVSRPDRLETESGEAPDVQFTGVVVVVDDEYQRPGRNVARFMCVHLELPTGVETTESRRARLSGSDTRRADVVQSRGSLLRAVPLAWP
jgi:hypothetical protein